MGLCGPHLVGRRRRQVSTFVRARIEHRGKPTERAVECGDLAVLAPAESGSRLNCTATVEFKVPLVGGKIEGLIGRLIVPQFSIIQRFTAKWITENA